MRNVRLWRGLLGVDKRTVIEDIEFDEEGADGAQLVVARVRPGRGSASSAPSHPVPRAPAPSTASRPTKSSRHCSTSDCSVPSSTRALPAYPGEFSGAVRNVERRGRRRAPGLLQAIFECSEVCLRRVTNKVGLR